MNVFNKLLLIIPFIILFDFFSSGKLVTDKTLKIEKQKQRYYNAAKNYHYTYELHTSKHKFYVSESFILKAKQYDSISYTISPLFKKVNRYYIPKLSNEKEIYSLRLFSGVVIPLIALILLVLERYSNKKSVLFFSIKVVLIGDLIFLLL